MDQTHRISLQEAVQSELSPSLIVVCTWYGLSCQGWDAESRLWLELASFVQGRSRVERMVVVLKDERTVPFILRLFEVKWGEGEIGGDD